MTKRLLMLAGAGLLLSACGSTVQTAGTTSGVGSTAGETQSLSAPNAGGAGDQLSLPGNAPSSAGPDGSSRGSTPGTAQQQTTGHPRTPATPRIPSPGQSGYGFTSTQIKIGVAISSSANAAFATYGAHGLSFPDGKQLVKAYVSYLNRTGGIAGRRVVPVFYDYNASGNVSTSDQAACAAWTQDDHVAAALGVRAGASGSDDVLTPCLSKAGVPWLSGQGDAQKFAQYPQTLYAPALINSTRLGRSTVNALYATGFFGTHARIGVVYKDSPEMARAVDQGMAPALAAHGLSIALKAGENNAFTESANIELKFATTGITHVLFAAPGGAAPWQFMQNASESHHHYKYGISSDDQPAIVLQQFAPRDQLVNTEGLGYAPDQDVSPSRAPKPTPSLADCLRVFRGRLRHFVVDGAIRDGLRVRPLSVVAPWLARRAGVEHRIVGQRCRQLGHEHGRRRFVRRAVRARPARRC